MPTLQQQLQPRPRLPLTENEMTIDKLLSEAASWVDFSDRSTWFCDYELTVPALRPQDVRYVKNKAPGGPITYVNGGLELDSEGRAYFDMGKDDSPPMLYPNLRRAGYMYNMVLSSTYDHELENNSCVTQGYGRRRHE